MNRTWGLILAAATLAGLAGGCGRGGSAAAPGERPPFWAFGCGEDQRFLVCFTAPDSALLVAPDRLHHLARIPTASGAAYADATDTFWTKGEEAMLQRPGGSLRGCRPTGRQAMLADLWRAGAVFTAAGNDPFWTLTIWPDSLVLVRDLGAARHRHDVATGTTWGGAAAGYADAAAGVAVQAAPGPCLDSLSGAPFPWQVTVRWDGQELTGCGLDLRPGR